MDEQKYEHTKRVIEITLAKCKKPVALCSFGKDSIVMLDLLRKVKPDIDIIFFREPYFQQKFIYAQKIMADWNLTVYDYPPSFFNYILLDDYFEIFNYYYTNGLEWLILYMGCCKYDKDKPFLCAKDLLNRPTCSLYTFNWDCVFLGQKETDPVHITNKKIILKEIYKTGKGLGILPLKDWTNDDVWSYIKANNLPYDKDRYENKNDNINPDKYPTCYDCLDYKNGKTVICPKQQKETANIGKTKEQHSEFKKTMLSSIKYLTEED